MHMTQFTCDVDLELEEQFVYQCPWGAPSLMGLKGYIRGEKEQKQKLIIYEWPMVGLNLHRELSKQDKEILHLDRFNGNKRGRRD